MDKKIDYTPELDDKHKIFKLPVKALTMSFDVRTGLNEDRVLFFMEMYEAGENLPPIEVIRGTMNIHDGRHRREALKLIDRELADCVFVEPMEFADQLMDSFARNVSDAPFHPTQADTIYVMKQLLENGTSNSKVQKGFEKFYSQQYVRKLLKDAHSSIGKAKMSRAKLAVIDEDKTIKEAARLYDVDPKRLKEEISGIKNRDKATRSIKEIKGQISNRSKSSTGSIIQIFRQLIERYRAGEVRHHRQSRWLDE